MVKVCKHLWRKLYFRRMNKEKNNSDWIIIENKFICAKCQIIKELK